MVLVQKSPFFQLFFFRYYRPGKCHLRYSRKKKNASLGQKPKLGQENVFYEVLEQKNAFLGYKNKKFSKSRKIAIFPKRLTHGFGPKEAIFPTSFF